MYKCIKCGNEKYETGEIRTAGGFLSKMFDIQNKKFHTISCKECGYTEIYKRKSGVGSNIADWFIG